MRVQRFADNPIIRPEMLPDDDGANINGPSLIRASNWLPNRLGRYYLYFAHHTGEYIRLAYSDDLRGPWRIHEPGTLRLGQTPFHGHIASPDVHVDDDRQQLRMYFHGPLNDDDGEWIGQGSGLAVSTNGIEFTCRAADIGPAYMRVFRWRGYWYAVAMPGTLLRSPDGLGVFEQGPRFIEFTDPAIERMRHCAVLLLDDCLRVFFSCVGDTPEHIMCSDVPRKGDWRTWRGSEPVSVVKPQMEYEGGGLPLQPSEGGPSQKPARQLRDPNIYRENGHIYLLYSVAGESGIAITELQRTQ